MPFTISNGGGRKGHIIIITIMGVGRCTLGYKRGFCHPRTSLFFFSFALKGIKVIKKEKGEEESVASRLG